ncbi:2'-5' RNA ligase family protein [Nocardia higoensis]|uniref:2'-5' RNA ligase family protein n=1 Tax=Nocardia higoensis TaxID=228599 RepID=UPI0003079AF8|nr:2'-5' RNA ligase family protein [Nocardia higoensis]
MTERALSGSADTVQTSHSEADAPKSRAHNFFWTVLAAAATVSITGNATQALLHDTPLPVVAAAVAVIPPLALLAAVHGVAVLARAHTATPATRWVATAMTVLIAAGAFWLSFTALRSLAITAGVPFVPRRDRSWNVHSPPMRATPKSPFPALPPASTSDAAAIRDNDWTAFRQLERVDDHWTLKSWTPGQSGFYWYLTFDDTQLVELAVRCQKELTGDGIDFVPPDGLHLTLLKAGRSVDLSEAQLSTIVETARRRLTTISPFDLDVGPLTGSRSALRFSVTPWSDLLELHRALREATATSRPHGALSETTRFRPHLGIGYINTPQSAMQLIDEVATLRDLPPVTVSVTEVRLVQLRREDRRYRWTDRAVVVLGG